MAELGVEAEIDLKRSDSGSETCNYASLVIDYDRVKSYFGQGRLSSRPIISKLASQTGNYSDQRVISFKVEGRWNIEEHLVRAYSHQKIPDDDPTRRLISSHPVFEACYSGTED